jgi:hypothetical protein
MPWFRKQSVPAFDGIDPADAASLELAEREGEHPCAFAGCTAMTGLQCEYVDRRERHCRTAWCPAHRFVHDRHVYCRRHVGVVTALPTTDFGMAPPLPDLDNRAPSLVGWMAKLLDADIWRLMLAQGDTPAGAQLISDPVSLVFVGIDRQRAWERAWTLASHQGEPRRVSIVVEETNDSEVVVKVGANVVDRLTPPWIVHRRNNEQVPEAQDAEERTAFNQRVLDAMERGLIREDELAAQARGNAREHRYVPAAGQGPPT